MSTTIIWKKTHAGSHTVPVELSQRELEAIKERHIKEVQEAWKGLRFAIATFVGLPLCIGILFGSFHLVTSIITWIYPQVIPGEANPDSVIADTSSSPPPGCLPDGNLPDELLATIKALADTRIENLEGLIKLAQLIHNAQCEALRQQTVVAPPVPKKPFFSLDEINLCKDKEKRNIKFTINPSDGLKPVPVCIPANLVWTISTVAVAATSYLLATNSATYEEAQCNMVKVMEKFGLPAILTSNSEPCPPADDNRLN